MLGCDDQSRQVVAAHSLHGRGQSSEIISPISQQQEADSRNQNSSTRDHYYARNRTTDITRKTALGSNYSYKPPRGGPIPNQSSLAYTMMGAVVE